MSASMSVNAVFVWLNETLGLSIPTLPLTRWPSVMTTLWNMLTKGPVPPPVSSPDSWVISIPGSLDGMLPPGATIALENLTIVVEPAGSTQ